MTSTENLLGTLEEGNLPILEGTPTESISKKRWKKMQSPEFTEIVKERYGRPRNKKVKYVGFVLTEKHAVLLIYAAKALKSSDLFDTIDQYPLGNWNLVENRAEIWTHKHRFEGKEETIQIPVVVSVYKTDRKDAEAVLK